MASSARPRIQSGTSAASTECAEPAHYLALLEWHSHEGAADAGDSGHQKFQVRGHCCPRSADSWAHTVARAGMKGWPGLRAFRDVYRAPGQDRPGALWSGMDRAAGAVVEADRLHDRERGGPGVDLDVGTAQDAGVFRDDGGGRVLGDGVEVSRDRGPHVLSVVLEDRSRVDRGQCLA